jgi:hypothetical protein
MNDNPYSPPIHLYEQTPEGPKWRGPEYRYRPLNGLLLAHLIVAIISLIGFAILHFAERVTPTVDSDLSAIDSSLWSPYTTIFLLASLAMLLMFIAWHVLFLIATYRLACNAHALGAPSPTITPFFAVCSYFIPVLNLFVPFQALRQCFLSCGLSPGILLPAFWIWHLIYSALFFASFVLGFLIASEFESKWLQWWDVASENIIYVELPVDIVMFMLSQSVLTRLAARQGQIAVPSLFASHPRSVQNDPPPMRFSSWGGD